ncbi:unnamed protein product, partial [Linum tenue]
SLPPPSAPKIPQKNPCTVVDKRRRRFPFPCIISHVSPLGSKTWSLREECIADILPPSTLYMAIENIPGMARTKTTCYMSTKKTTGRKRTCWKTACYL